MGVSGGTAVSKPRGGRPVEPHGGWKARVALPVTPLTRRLYGN